MKTILTTALAVGVVGCASQPKPTSEVASAVAAVRGAEEAGALEVPEAALHLKLAEEQVERARELISHEKNGRAQAVAVRAYHDAELAIALARQVDAKRSLEQFATNHPTAGGEVPSTGGQATEDSSRPSESDSKSQ